MRSPGLRNLSYHNVDQETQLTTTRATCIKKPVYTTLHNWPYVVCGWKYEVYTKYLGMITHTHVTLAWERNAVGWKETLCVCVCVCTCMCVCMCVAYTGVQPFVCGRGGGVTEEGSVEVCE